MVTSTKIKQFCNKLFERDGIAKAIVTALAGRPAYAPLDKSVNVVEEYLVESKETKAQWDSWCHKLASKVSEYCTKKNIKHKLLWIKRRANQDPDHKHSQLTPSRIDRQWRYHVVVMVDDLVHDLWFGAPVPIDEYLDAMFPDQDVVATPGSWNLEQLVAQAGDPNWTSIC